MLSSVHAMCSPLTSAMETTCTTCQQQWWEAKRLFARGSIILETAATETEAKHNSNLYLEATLKSFICCYDTGPSFSLSTLVLCHSTQSEIHTLVLRKEVKDAAALIGPFKLIMRAIPPTKSLNTHQICKILCITVWHSQYYYGDVPPNVSLWGLHLTPVSPSVPKGGWLQGSNSGPSPQCHASALMSGLTGHVAWGEDGRGEGRGARKRVEEEGRRSHSLDWCT